jgi:hypothetical protein
MNKGIHLTSGRWLCFLGSDDTLCNSLEVIASYLIDERTIYYGNVLMTGSQKLYDGMFGEWKLSRRNICQQAIFYPRPLVESRLFDLRYRLRADWKFNLRSYSDSRFGFQFTPVTVANYNDFSGRRSVGIDPQFRMDHVAFYASACPRLATSGIDLGRLFVR